MNEKLQTWHFESNNDELVDLVLKGKKTAISLINGEKYNIGDNLTLNYENEKKACIIKIIKIVNIAFNDVTWDLASLEGSAEDLEDWKQKCIKDIKKTFNDLNENPKIMFIVFEVTKNFKEERLNIAKKIVNNNLIIFKENSKVEEINAGFNNNIFNVNDHYIIKVCGNSDKENEFDIENNFYEKNSEYNFIPKMIKFDNTKQIVPYYYEIMEKIEGKSIYYYWYRWSESQRENFIKKLMEILKKLHKKNYPEYNWADKIKNEIINLYHINQSKFTSDEKNIIEKSLESYEKILNTVHSFSLIHCDLHFDNIILTKSSEIKIIDFNDSIIAPFDYDLRILFMCKNEPWKWANSEMDPFQKPKDYKNIIKYIKKYYPELNEIKYLDKRMYIYMILKDFRHLEKYNERKLIDNIVNYSQKIIK